MKKISRDAYADMYGPTTGDKIRLADTELFIEVEKDLTTYGEEVKFGGGKVIRDGMGQSQVSRKDGAVDTVGSLVKAGTNMYSAAQDVGMGNKSLLEAAREQNSNLGIGALLTGQRGGEGAIAAGLNRYFGSAPNPHITTLFQGVGLRQHNYNWKLAPANKKETESLAKIIDSLRASAVASIIASDKVG